MDIMEAIRNRRSVRDYSDKPIPKDVMEELKEALRVAPSACNYQPWKFILVTDAELRRKVAEASNKQMWMADAPVIVVAVGFPGTAYTHMGGAGNSVDVDLGIALDHLTLAATAQGIGTCWIGAFREEAVRELLGIPASCKIVALTPLGYPGRPDLLRPVPEGKRKPASEIFCENRFE